MKGPNPKHLSMFSRPDELLQHLVSFCKVILCSWGCKRYSAACQCASLLRSAQRNLGHQLSLAAAGQNGASEDQQRGMQEADSGQKGEREVLQL